MGTTVREVVGWLIMLLGLILIAKVLDFAVDKKVIEAMALSFPAAIVFRAGIGLVRMSAASRVAMKLNRSKSDA